MRQFLALALPDELRQELAAWTERARCTASGWRWVPPSDVHLTLRFLGEVDEARDRAARDTWRRAAAEQAAFAYRLADVGVFPERGRPRILWVGVAESRAEGRLAVLAERLEHASRALGFAPEPRPFRPHLTLARVARGGRAGLPSTAGPFSVETRVEVVSLFRSDLGATGARYTCLEQFPLARHR